MTPRPTWRKSTYSADSQNCVELATVGPDGLLRNSKRPADVHLTFTRAALAAFVAAARAGELDDLS